MVKKQKKCNFTHVFGTKGIFQKDFFQSPEICMKETHSVTLIIVHVKTAHRDHDFDALAVPGG